MAHDVARLRHACLTQRSDRPRLDRGDPPDRRCAGCRLLHSHCMCALRPVVPTRAAVCLLMAGFEALKPSNTGWLIADVVPATTAFAWSRIAVDPALLALLADPQWQPYLVFPGEFAAPQRVVGELAAARLDAAGRQPARPLFVVLDGTWSEACKIFRKSPYLDRLPVLSLQPERLSRYRLRRSIHGHHLCTAEVAARCLVLAGDLHAARTLDAYLDVYSHRYLRARQSVPPDSDDEAHRRLRELNPAPTACRA